MIEQEKEFKYKGRRIFDNKWVYGSYMKQGNNHFIIPKVNKNGYAKCIAVDPNSVSKYDEKGELNG